MAIPFSNSLSVPRWRHPCPNSEGRRETLRMAVDPAETEAFWTEFLRSLVRRGPEGVHGKAPR